MTSQTSGTGREPAQSCAECGTRAEPGQSFCDSCGAVLGWSGGRSGAAAAQEPDPVPAGAAAPARDSAARRTAGDEPGWDAFAHPGAGTGTARTAHDPGPAVAAGSAGGRPAEDETHRRAASGPDTPSAHGQGAQGPVLQAPGAHDAGARGSRTDGSPSAAPPSDGSPSDDGPGAHAPGAHSPGTRGRRERAQDDDWPGDDLRGGGPADRDGDAGAAAARSGTHRPDTAPGAEPGPGTRQPDAAHASGQGAGAAPPRPASAGSGSAPHPSRSAGTAAASASGSGAAAAGSASPGRRDPDEADTEPVVTADPYGPHPSGGQAGSADSAGERARSLLIPVNDPEPRAPASPAVAPVLPGRPVAGRPQVRAPGPESGPEGGPPCPWCATPNRPDRHFCGRCAMPMEGGPGTPGRQPWWRRVLNRDTETHWAGDRPRLRRGFGRVMNWVVGAVVLALIVTLVLNIGAGVDATRDHFAKRAPIGPTSVKASRSYPGHSPQLVFDKLSNTWWGPGVSQTGEGQWVEARFDRPTRLLDLVITSGMSTKVDQLQKSALPQRIEARITTADGKKTTRTITLDQSAGGQRRKFRVADVVAVRFILRSAYAADAKKQVAIAEIEFFGRSKSNTT
ncbi:NADase-type glycan-binding domain-containing protein [Streptomyces sp. NPDC020802]|uniref:NADase-type glycan-binding domain-containing protein n=2 Tax=unclassified Streptomyces TaxID=2593676 RepID=UPI0037AF612C